MREVAALAGVSGKTVSRVINGDRYVSDDVRRRVQRAVDELQYVPNMLSQAFRNGRDNAIGIAVPSLADSFFSAVVQAVADEAHARRTAVLIINLGDRPDEEQSAVEALLHRHISGLIIAPTSLDHRYIRPWQQRTQVVFVDRPPHRVVADSVLQDDVAGARSATLELLDGGHRRVAFVGNGLAVDTPRRRLEGYRSALTDRGLGCDPALEVFDHDDREFGARTVSGLLALPDPPTAIFSSNSQMSLRLVSHLHARGRTDIGFVSFGDFPMADSLQPTVSVVDQDPVLLGVTAVHRLFDRIDGPRRRLKRQIVLPVTLLVRQSSAGPHRMQPPIPVMKETPDE